MKIKISEKVLCIPPYISTTWDKVSFLQTEEDSQNRLTLILTLNDGKTIHIPHLDQSIIDITFAAHLKFLEQNINSQVKDNAVRMNSLLGNLNTEQVIGIPLRLGPGMEGFESAFQHNPAQSNSPEIPQEVLNKLSAIAKIVANGEQIPFPKPEPHCNCLHCQLARAIHGIEQEPEVSSEDIVSDEDLKFRLWDIAQSGDKLYLVTNPDDLKEQYSVYLGSPIGCTCGHAKCDHIRAVLAS